mgnify:CR=1 FL=1
MKEIMKMLEKIGLTEEHLRLLEILSFEKNLVVGYPPMNFRIVTNYE